VIVDDRREAAMTPLVRLYVKTSFVFLLLGLVLGGYVTIQVNLLGRGVPWPLITAHVHVLLVGFLLTLVFGVATWMFPRPARDDARYHPGLAWLVYWLLTASTAIRALGEVGAAVVSSRGSPLAALGGLGQLVAAIVFVANMWTRVRMPGPIAPQQPPR
jgi:hypothetical protein